MNFKAGNGQSLQTRYAIEIPIKIQSHSFIVKALALDTLGGLNLVIGSPSMADIDACLEFRHNRLRFKHSTFPLKLTKSVVLKPKYVQMVTVTARLPTALRDATLFVKPTSFISKFTASHMLLQFRNGYANLLLTNTSEKPVTLCKDKLFAVIDLRFLTQMYSQLLATDSNDRNTTLYYHATKSDSITDNANNTCSTGSTDNTTTTDDKTTTNMSRADLYKLKSKKFPFLDPSDPRLSMHDHEIIDRDVVFANSQLNVDQQQKVKQLLLKYSNAFSLHSEVGNTDLTIDFELTDTQPFYIRPFTVSPAEKPIIDRELQKLVSLGVLQEHHSAYSSPVMLLKKPNSTDFRLVTDFRHLNGRIQKRNLPFPLIRETLQTIGQARPTVVSVLDLKQAYHCLNLSKRCQEFCGITSYYGGRSFRYLKLPQGLSISPSCFQQHINKILSKANANSFCVGIMDDLIVFSKSVDVHYDHIATILKALSDNGLKISPSKTKLFRSKVIYMGHEILVNKHQQGIRPLRDRTEAIRKMPRPSTKRMLKGFIGKVSYLAMFLPKLQVLLQPLHKIASKKADFKWTEVEQTAYNSIVQLLVKPPVLSLPRSTGMFRLYVDTSRVGVGANLWQIQDGQERLLAYYSKALPKASKHYGVSELELTGLCYAIHAFRHLLKNTTFQVFTDHSSIPLLLKSKAEPSSDRIKRLLERLSGYSIQIGFRKGSEMVIADYLSRNPCLSDNDPIDDLAFPMLTRRQAQRQGVQMPTVQQTVAKQTCKQVYKDPIPSVPQVQQPVPQVQQPVPQVQQPPAAHRPVMPQNNQRHEMPQYVEQIPPVQPAPPILPPPAPPVAIPPPMPQFRPPIPLQPQNVFRPPPEQISETHDVPPRHILQQPLPLQLQTDEILARHLPKQADIDRMLRKLETARIQDIHLPFNKRELALLQAQCPNFKDIYFYILEGMLPSPRLAAKRIMVQAEQYIMVDKILFKLPVDETLGLRLVIPQSLVHEVLYVYHDSLLAAHQGIARVTATLRQKFYFKRMHQMILNYIRSCRTCQARKSPTDTERPFHLNIPVDYVPFQTIHADLKTMPPSNRNHRYLLVLVCNITRYCILVPITSKDASTVAEAVLEKCVFQFGPCKDFVSDLGKEWDNSVLSYIFKALRINQRFVSVGNHQSNKSERFIGTVSSLLTSYLTTNGRDWHLYANAIAYAYNSFVSPALGNHSPFYLVYLRHPPTVFANPPTTQVSYGYLDYVTILKSRLDTVSRTMLDIQAKLQHTQAEAQKKKVRNPPDYSPGTLVYLLAPSCSALQIASRKLRLDFIGPLVVKEVLDRSHVILMTLESKQVPSIIHVSRLKPAFVRCGLDVATTIDDLRKRSNKLIPNSPVSEPKSSQPTGSLHSVLSPSEYDICKFRYKCGELQALLKTKQITKHNLWFSIPEYSDFVSEMSSIRVVGSFQKFVGQLV